MLCVRLAAGLCVCGRFVVACWLLLLLARVCLCWLLPGARCVPAAWLLGCRRLSGAVRLLGCLPPVCLCGWLGVRCLRACVLVWLITLYFIFIRTCIEMAVAAMED